MFAVVVETFLGDGGGSADTTTRLADIPICGCWVLTHTLRCMSHKSHSSRPQPRIMHPPNTLISDSFGMCQSGECPICNKQEYTKSHSMSQCFSGSYLFKYLTNLFVGHKNTCFLLRGVNGEVRVRADDFLCDQGERMGSWSKVEARYIKFVGLTYLIARIYKMYLMLYQILPIFIAIFGCISDCSNSFFIMIVVARCYL